MSSSLSDLENFDEKNSIMDCDSTTSSSVLSILSSPNTEELSPTQQTYPLVAKDTFILHPPGYTATPSISHIIPGQVQLTPLHMSPISMQSPTSPTSPTCKPSNQFKSREILPKIETKPNEISQYERERRRNYARLLREKKRARVKELEDRAAFLVKENKRLRKNLEIYYSRLAYAGIFLIPSNTDIPFGNVGNVNICSSMNNFIPCMSTTPEFNFLSLENQITPEEILNMPMGFIDPIGDSSVPTFTNLINMEDNDHDPVDYYFGVKNESTTLK
ncbi:hypothetical protein C2G38_2045086 [Gigaspora rosea]|uniref:BZIP domain-containing protein n=1 Tax=Gigaspora rosea TaxID=44941 RepID=A0A397UIA8_9GLOM|nr:hypothetical protein C2G38_2045086 [Gigaspora rosea]